LNAFFWFTLAALVDLAKKGLIVKVLADPSKEKEGSRALLSQYL